MFAGILLQGVEERLADLYVTEMVRSFKNLPYQSKAKIRDTILDSLS